MTLLFMDGFHGGDANSKWNIGGSYTRAAGTPRFTGGAYASGTTTLAKTITASSEIFCGIAMYWGGFNAGLCVQFCSDSNATVHITVMRNATGQIEVRRGTTAGTIIATGTTIFADNTWQHLQIRVTISDTVGVVEVRLNGSSSNEISFSGDTKNAGTNTTIDAVRLNGSGSFWYLTDCVIMNTAGSVNNTWPGDCRVQTLVPTADGNTSQGVGSDGNSVSNWQLVDDLPFSSTDYVGVTTDTQGDTYGLTDLTTGTNTVKGVQVNLYSAKSDAGAKSIKRRLRSAGTTYAGSAVLLGTTSVTLSEVLEQDPATSAAWTVANVNALEAGFEAAP